MSFYPKRQPDGYVARGGHNPATSVRPNYQLTPIPGGVDPSISTDAGYSGGYNGRRTYQNRARGGRNPATSVRPNYQLTPIPRGVDPSISTNVGHYGGYNGRRTYPNRATGGGFSRQIQRFPRSMPETSNLPPLVAQKLPRGTVGEELSLLGNFFPIEITTGDSLVFYHYHVSIELQMRDGGAAKDAFPHLYPNIIKSVMQDLRPEMEYLHDGFANLYVAKRLEPEQKIPHQFGEKKFLVKIVETVGSKIDIANVKRYYEQKAEEQMSAERRSDEQKSEKSVVVSEQVINLLNLLFRKIFETKYTRNNGNYYDLPEDEIKEVNGQQWKTEKKKNMPFVKLFDFVSGFVASVRMAEFGLALNLHLKTGVIISRQFTCNLNCPQVVGLCDHTLDRFVLTFITAGRSCDNFRILENINETQIENVSKMVKGFKIMTYHGKSTLTYTIKKVILKKPSEQFFESYVTDPDTNERTTVKTSVQMYFNRIYPKIDLKQYPLVVASQPGSKDSHIPMELCHLVSKQFIPEYKYDPFLKDQLPKESSHQPEDYFQKVNSRVKEIAAIDPEILDRFQLNLITQPFGFNGRVLPAPVARRPIDTDFAQVKGKQWCLISFDESCQDSHLDNFLREFMLEANKANLYFDEPKGPIGKRFISLSQCTAQRVESALENIKRKIEPDFVLIVIPENQQAAPSLRPDELHNLSKYFTDFLCQIVCQNVNGNELKNPKNGYFKTILLSINGKLGGKNKVVDIGRYIPDLPFKLSELSEMPPETMIMGIDVNHPGHGETIGASIAVAVGSTDCCMYNFSCSIRVQPKQRVELVQDLSQMTEELLVQFFKTNGAYPKSIFIFRDGVSDGQFGLVLEEELPKIQSATDRLKINNCKLTLVVVQKRHITRFALKEQGCKPNSNTPTFNVPNGTVVDSMIVDPFKEKMLELNSHFSYIGTSHPTKYVVLLDEHRLTTDQLEQFCYFSCHHYIGCNSILSIPTPVQYADLCAAQAKIAIQGYLLVNPPALDERSVMSGNNHNEHSISDDFLILLNDVVQPGELSKNRMFYV